MPADTGQVAPDEQPRLVMVEGVAEERFPCIARLMTLLSAGPGPDLVVEVVIVEIGARLGAEHTRRRSARDESA